jgi:hypothetical protein
MKSCQRIKKTQKNNNKKTKQNKRPMGLIGHLSIMQQLSNALI